MYVCITRTYRVLVLVKERTRRHGAHRPVAAMLASNRRSRRPAHRRR